MSLLEVSGLNSYYGDSHILFDIALRVEANEVVALLGRNGAGKTTTLKSLMGMVRPRSGSIRLDGQEIAGKPAHAIARVGMQLVPEERRGSRGTDLSGGEQQMLAIARALVRDPKIILLDEPFEGLAPIIVRDLLATCRTLAEAGQTIIVVEQNISAAVSLADRFYILNNGHVVEEASAQAVRDRPELLHRHLGV